MPRLWTETIETHRREVRAAIVDTTSALVAEHGLRAVTMSQIAEGAGVGRATLYKYFPDVETILVAWHDRQVTIHLDHLVEVGEQHAAPGERLRAVLGAYALITFDTSRRDHGTALVALVHRTEHVAEARHRLSTFISNVVTEGTTTGHVRTDVAPDVLASYCLHALAAAASLPSEAAVHRLVEVTLAGLRPGHGSP